MTFFSDDFPQRHHLPSKFMVLYKDQKGNGIPNKQLLPAYIKRDVGGERQSAHSAARRLWGGSVTCLAGACGSFPGQRQGASLTPGITRSTPWLHA